MNNNKYMWSAITFLRTTILIFLTIGLSWMSITIYNHYMFERTFFTDKIESISHIVFFFLIFISLYFSFYKNNKNIKEKFLDKAKDTKLLSNVRFVVKSFDFYIEIITIVFFSVLLPNSFAFGFASKIICTDEGASKLENKLYSLAVILPIMIAIVFASRLIIQRKWYIKAKFGKDMTQEKKSNISSEVWTIIAIALISSAVSMVSSWLTPPIVSLWDAGGIKIFVWILLIPISAVALLFSVLYIRVSSTRNSFVRKIKKYCKENSAIFYKAASNEKYNFVVEKNKIKYTCKLISSKFPNYMVNLFDSGNAEIESSIYFLGTDWFSTTKNCSFEFDSDGKKVLIFVPMPKKIRVSVDESLSKSADTGDEFGDYRIYSTLGFLNELERGNL